MNMVGRPPAKCGLTICALPTELNALTKWADGKAFCSRSISESVRVVKYDSTPLTGGPPPIGLQASITVLPWSAFGPMSFSASSATCPATASTTTSPKAAASAKVLTAAPGCFSVHSFSFARSRVPIATSWPCLRKPAAKVCATTPEPMIPIFMDILPWGLSANAGDPLSTSPPSRLKHRLDVEGERFRLVGRGVAAHDPMRLVDQEFCEVPFDRLGAEQSRRLLFQGFVERMGVGTID